MKTFIFKFVLAIIYCGIFSSSIFARVGETRQELEGRLESKTGGAYLYSSKEERLRETLELPYKNLVFLFPRSIQHSFYYKRPNASLSVNADTVQQYEIYGWEVHIMYKNDQSVWEFYRRQGDPMTMEELVELMALIANTRNSKWKEVEELPTVNTWEMYFDGKKLCKVGKLDGKTNDKSELKSALPQLENRFIYVEIPNEVKSAPNYNQSLTFLMEEDAQRSTYESYRNYVAKQSATSAARTARGNYNKKGKTVAPKKINPFDGRTNRQMESIIFESEKSKGFATMFRYHLKDVFFGGKAPVNRSKDIQITMSIPIQKDTCIGYDYELADGSIRAKLYNNGVLFCNADFDKSMRDEIEKLYRKQENERIRQAEESISKF